MKHFISFQKKKALWVERGTQSNEPLVYQINHELMKYGYAMTEELFEILSTQTIQELQIIYADLFNGICDVVGPGGYEPIYKNFPNDVIELSHKDFVLNAIRHYWSEGEWRPNDASHIKREYAIEPINYKMVGLLSKFEFINIFYNIIYSNNSLSVFDKKCIDWYLTTDIQFDYNKIGFKETQAYIGKSLLEIKNLVKLPIKDATLVLRIWTAYSGGDEGLKTNTKFKLPNNRQRRLLRNTLNECYNLEESFKTYREKWLRFLFYLNPYKYPTTHKTLKEYTELLRNNPKQLKTFNSRIEEKFQKGDITVLQLLSKRMGVFTRKLDHCVREFGESVIDVWLNNNPTFEQMINVYNHFSTRDSSNERSAILAGNTRSEMVTYKALAPLNSGIVKAIQDKILEKMKLLKIDLFDNKKVFIDHLLYFRPIASNNRASSMSLSTTPKGTLEDIPKGKTLRMYVHWVGKSDIDLSAMIIHKNGSVIKVGWNGNHSIPGVAVYSGDNTGYSSKNAEYLDINTEMKNEVEWVILDAKIYTTRINGYNEYPHGDVRAGWMLRKEPHSNTHWLPETVANASIIECDSRTAFLMALHIPSRKLVHLDISSGDANVSTPDEALRMKIYLDKLITITSDNDEIPWKVINQGQILNILADKVVLDPEEADIIYDENTTSEEVSRLLNIT